MTAKLFWQNDEKKPVVCFRARSGPRADNRSWFVTTIPAHRDNEGMKAAALKTDMVGLSYKPSWLARISHKRSAARPESTIPTGVQLQKASSKYFNMSVGFLTL
jgi:hypothetical protein